MIVNWRKEAVHHPDGGVTERFVTEWRGMLLDLGQLPTGRWGLIVVAAGLDNVLDVNGKPGAIVRQRWATARAAMADIDTAMDHAVAGLAKQGVQARQRGFAQPLILAVQGA